MKEEKIISIFGRKIKQSDLFKIVGLFIFLLLMTGIVVFMWPMLSGIFEPGGVERVIEEIRDKGIAGAFILLGLQLLQIVVAFIPGEVVQVAAGMLYGPWLGSLLILIGCVLSSALIYELVHRLGAPFVRSMVGEKHLEQFSKFENSNKLNITVLILFLIPGFPKDILTYIVPLTNMKISTFLCLSTLGRIPGVFLSTYAASGLLDGNIASSVAIIVVAAIVLLIVALFKNRIMALIHAFTKKD